MSKMIVVFHHQLSVVHQIHVYEKNNKFYSKYISNLFLFSFNQVIQQPSTCVCVAQQKPQVLLCTDSNPVQNYICSSSCDVIPQVAVPQQQYLSITSASPQVITQIPAVSTPAQQFASVVLQQPLQIIPAQQASSGQYIKISSASPQVIQTIPGPNVLGVQPSVLQAQPVIQALQRMYI